MVYKLSILLRIVIRNSLKVLFFLPVKKNRIIFQSYNTGNGYNCNPKYICEYIKSAYPNQYELIWSFQSLDLGKNIEGIRPVVFKSCRWLYYMITAEIVIINTTPVTFLPKRKNQLVINTWHAGGAYKKIALQTKKNDLDSWRAKQAKNYVDVFLSSSKMFTKTNICEGYRFSKTILETGMPRCDIFFDDTRIQRAREKVRKELQITGTAVLYAPTYRGSFLKVDVNPIQLPYNEIRMALRNVTDSDVTFLRRNHYQDINYYNEKKVIDVTYWSDMQELLCAADILITDYSSCIWDFSLTGKPCIIYLPDFNDMGEDFNRFYTHPKTWPGILCRSKEELISELSNIDCKQFKTRAKDHLALFGSFEEGDASKKTCDFFRDWQNNS